MANRNIQMKKRNGETWDNMYPITLSDNVFNKNGDSVTEQLAQTNNKIPSSRESYNHKYSVLGNRRIIAHPNSTFIEWVGGSRVDITQNPKYLKAVKNSPDNPAYIQLAPSNPVNVWSEPTIEFVISFSDFTDVSNVNVRVYPTEDNSKYWTLNINKWLPEIARPFEPIRVTIYTYEFNPVGGVTDFYMTASGKFLLSFNAPQGTKAFLSEGVSAFTPPCPVVIQFDDGFNSIYNIAFKEMQKRGIVGTFNVETGHIENPDFPNYCTWEQLREMQDAGWTIGNHTRYGTNALAVTPNEAIQAIADGYKDLSDRGFSGGRYYAPVQNAFNDELQAMARHIIVSRKHPGSKGRVLRQEPDVFPIASNSVQVDETANSIFSEYTRKKETGQYFSCTFHTISKDGSGNIYDFKESEFIKLLDLFVEDGAFFWNVEQLVNKYLIRYE